MAKKLTVNEAEAKVAFMTNAMSQLVQSRMSYAGMGTSNSKRGFLWNEFGYPSKIDFSDYYGMYERNSVAYAGIHATLENSWSDYPEIIDGDDEDDSSQSTPFETSANAILKRFMPQIKDADRRNMVGRYSALIIQVKDGKQLSEPMGKIAANAIVRMIPVWECQLKVATKEESITSENYGLPTMYNFITDGSNSVVNQTQIHPSRVIIIAEGSEDGLLTSGVPLNKAGFNDLLDIEKTKGGSAEGFLKNASRQLAIEFADGTNMQKIAQQAQAMGYDDVASAFNEQIADLNSGTDSAMVMQAGTASVLSVAAADPTNTFTTSANCYAATIGCPFNILFGKQTGNLASTEDKVAWAKRGNTRRQNFLNSVFRSIIDWMMTYGVLDRPSRGDYSVVFTDLLSPSDADKLANMQAMADVMQKVQQATAESPFTIDELRAVGGYDPVDNEKDKEMPTAPEVDDEDNENQ